MPFQGEAESTFGHLLPSLSEHRNTPLNRQAKKRIPDLQLSVIRPFPDENLTKEPNVESCKDGLNSTPKTSQFVKNILHCGQRDEESLFPF